ncbi:unnamed protein product [Ixodes hexagonus]
MLFSDGPNTMKSVKKKLQSQVSPNLLDIGECNLHKLHNAFAKGLNAFGMDVEQLVIDIYYHFKSATRTSDLREHQQNLGLPEHVFLRHVNNRWLTLQGSLERLQEQLPALKSFFKSNAESRPSVGPQHNRVASALKDKQLLAKIMFLKDAADLYSGFQTLFQMDKPLVHIIHSELVGLVKKLLSRFITHDILSKSAEQLKFLNLDSSKIWKEVPEIGHDTEEEMKTWESHEKRAFRTAARAFYLACARSLLTQLPLDNKLLFHLRFLSPCQTVSMSEVVCSLKYVAGAVPQIVKPEQVSSLLDEWYSWQCENVPKNDEEGVDEYWAKVFNLKSSLTQDQKYPLLSLLVKAVLSLPHGNAECERGFSENKHMLQGRANLGVASICGMRQVKSYLKRFDSDVTKVPLTADLLQAVKRAHKVYTERLEAEKQKDERQKRRSSDAREASSKRARLQEEERQLEQRIICSRTMLEHAQSLIESGLKNKEMEKIESGQVLLSEANTKLAQNLEKVNCIREQLAKKS